MIDNPGFDEEKFELRKRMWDAVKLRASGLCEKCGKEFVFRKGQLNASVHHRRMRRISGQDQIGNLVHLCNPCHKGIHKSPETERSAGYIGFIAWGDPRRTPFLLRGERWVLTDDEGSYEEMQAGKAQSLLTAFAELEPDHGSAEMTLEGFEGDDQLEFVDLGRGVRVDQEIPIVILSTITPPEG